MGLISKLKKETISTKICQLLFYLDSKVHFNSTSSIVLKFLELERKLPPVSISVTLLLALIDDIFIFQFYK